MSPQETQLDIPIGKGLAEGFDEKVLPFGSAAKLENFEVKKAGGITKRRGWAATINAAELDLSSLGEVRQLEGDGDALRCVAEDSDTGLPHLYHYSAAEDFWSDNDAATVGMTRRSAMIRTSLAVAAAAAVPFGNNAYEVVIYAAYDPLLGPATGTYYKIFDRVTGALVKAPSRLSTTGYTAIIGAVLVNDDAWILWADGGFKARKIDGTTLAETNLTIDATTPTDFDVNRFDISEFCVAYTKSTSTRTIYLAKISNGSATVSATGTYACPVGSEVGAPRVAGNGTKVHAAFYEGVTAGPPPDLKVIQVTSNLATVSGPYTLVAAPVLRGQHAIEIDSGNGSVVVVEVGDTARDGRVGVGFVSSGGVIRSPTSGLTRCRIASAPRLIGDRVFVALLALQSKVLECDTAGTSGVASSKTEATITYPGPVVTSTGDDAELYQATLWCCDEPTDTWLLCGKLGTLIGLGGLRSTPSKWWPRSTAELQWLLGGPVTDTLQLSGVDRFDLDVTPRQSGYLATARPRPLLAQGGSLPMTHDGEAAVELSFLQAPGWEEPAVSSYPVGGGIATAASPGVVYLYRARYEWPDGQGTLHVGPWSPDLTVTLIDPAAQALELELAITTTQATRRSRSSLGIARQPRIAVYRSTGNGASASGDVTYYRLAAYHDCPISDENTTVTVYDDASDATLLARGLGQVVSPGGTLAPLNPPASEHLCMHRGRLWLASAETGRDLWASLALTEGEPPTFAPELRVSLPDAPDRITALASLDDKLLIFTPTRIYYLVGEGPNDNGTGEYWPQPWPVVAQHGCVDARSVVVTPSGVFYQTSAGIALLDRGLSAQLVGESVRDVTDSYTTCLAATHDPKRSRVLWLFANADSETVGVVYDYLHQVWSRQDTAADDELHAQTVWQDQIVVAFAGAIRYEAEPDLANRRGYDRDSGGAGDWVTGIYETPWICPSGPGAYQRMRRLFLLGERLSVCRLKVEIFTNFDDGTAVQTHTIDLMSSTVVVGLPLLRYEVPLEIQACEAIKIRLTDLVPLETHSDATDLRAGISLQRMSLEYLPERGSPRLPATNRGGGT